MKTFQGGCHCGQVRFEIETDLNKAIECNCSICTKKGALLHRVPPENFRLLSDEDALTLYRFATGIAQHWFCRHCGIHAFNRPRAAPERYSINIRCLDDFHRLKNVIEIVPFDGQNWEEAVKALRS